MTKTRQEKKKNDLNLFLLSSFQKQELKPSNTGQKT